MISVVTMKDIAAKVGTSVCTVSLILNGKAAERKLSPETVQKVLSAARELGYSPNLAARRLRRDTAQVPLIALYWAADFRVSMLARFLRGLQQVPADGADPYTLQIIPYTPGRLHEQKSLQTGPEYNGAIIANAAPEDMEWLHRHPPAVPLSVYHRRSSEFSCVTVNDSAMGAMAARALLDAGKTSPAVLLPQFSHSGTDERERGFLTELEKAGCACAVCLEGENSVEGGRTLCGQLLASGRRIDGLFCASDSMAIGAMQHLRDRGLAIPEDVAVISIGNGDQEYTAAAQPPLSCVFLPMEDMAEACLRQLLRALKQGGADRQEILLKTPLLRRGSC